MINKNFIPRIEGALLFVFLTLGLAVTPALAHGKSELTVSPAEIAPGGAVTVKADGVEPGETYTITLEGPQFKANLGKVDVTQDTFEVAYSIPASAPADVYQVRAVSAGNEVISVELTVSGPDAATSAPESTVPTAELMQLPSSRTIGQVGAMIVIAIASVFVGLLLVRPGKHVS